jgi:DNA-binding XRE family transcriptional regulator
MQIHTPDEIAVLVRTRRHEVGLTQTALADRIGATRQWVNALESGRPRIELGLALRALAALGMTLNLRATDQAAERETLGESAREALDVPSTGAPSTVRAVRGAPRPVVTWPAKRPSLDAVLAAARDPRPAPQTKAAR